MKSLKSKFLSMFFIGYLDDNNEKQWRFHEGTPIEENEDGS